MIYINVKYYGYYAKLLSDQDSRIIKNIVKETTVMTIWKLDITRRELLATLVVALVGAIVSGLLVFFFFQDYVLDGWRTDPYISATVIFVLGFICCFLAFKKYLKRVEGKQWRGGLKYGFIICSLLGAVLGFITGIVVECFSGSPNLGNIIFLAFIGCIVFGFPIGAIVGLVFGLIFTAIIKRFNLSHIQLS